MKKFSTPMMFVVRLADENVIAASGICNDQYCEGYDCPNCPTICTGSYHCDLFKCTTY